MKKHSQWLMGILLLVCTLFVSRFYLGPQFPYTHDGENHLARFANYKLAVKELQIPPRIAPVLHNRFGYPVFNYNYPLANILSLPFSFARVSYQTTFAIIVIASLLSGSVGVYRWTSFFTKKDAAKLFTALVWLTTPFIVGTLSYRGSIGEVLAYSLLPWIFLAIHSLTKEKTSWQLIGLGILGSVFLLSHNITAVFALPLLLGYAIILFKKDNKSWKRTLIVGLIAIGGSLWFWLPAVVEMGATVVGSTENQSAYTQHFLTIRQLLTSPDTFGYSLPGKIDSLGLKIGLLSSILIVVSFFWCGGMLITTRKHTNGYIWQLSAYVAGAALFSFYMQLDISQFVWEQISVMRFMQFPWRWSLFFFTVSAPLIALLLSRATKKVFISIVVVWMYWLFQIGQIQPVDTFRKLNVDYDHFTLTTSTQNENMAKDFSYSAIGSWEPQAAALEPQANATFLTQVWNGREHIYTVATTQTITVVEPTMYFPGWETRVNGQLVEYVDSDLIKGRIAYTLMPGEYSITTQFTQNTPARLVGNAVFFLTIIAITYLGIYTKKKL